ncbi:hypothetical protein ABZ429_26110, partial [Streptomyces albidoflavus]
LAVPLGLLFYVRHRIGPRTWRRLHRFVLAVYTSGTAVNVATGTRRPPPDLRGPRRRRVSGPVGRRAGRGRGRPRGPGRARRRPRCGRCRGRGGPRRRWAGRRRG